MFELFIKNAYCAWKFVQAESVYPFRSKVFSF